jgi:ArsR family transcriptional regulator
MKILEDAGLVDKERQGTWMIYRQADSQESVYAVTMLHTLKEWLNEDTVLQRMVKALPETTCQRVYTLKK